MVSPFEEELNPYAKMSVKEIIDAALTRLDGVVLTPLEAQDILEFRLSRMEELIAGGILEPDEHVSDEEVALGEIARGDIPRCFGEIYRRYHISSESQLGMGGVRETALASDLEGSIWAEIDFWKFYKRQRKSN